MNYYEKIKSFFFGSIEKDFTREQAIISIYGYFWGLMDLTNSEQDQIELEKSYDQICVELHRNDY